jgi:hypothetical protein
MEEITIKGIKLEYTPVDQFWEKCGPLNRKTLAYDFLEMKRIFEENNLEFSLTCGTLLGAIRENNFIDHDIDIDIIIKDEYKLLTIIPKIQKHGFNFIRYQNDEKYTIYTFIRTNVYIDIYMAIPAGKYYYLWGGKVNRIYVDKLIPYKFLGEHFLIPKYYRRFLVLLYGKNWKIPVKNRPSDQINQDKIFRRYVLRILNKIKKFFPKGIKEILKRTLLWKKIRTI